MRPFLCIFDRFVRFSMASYLEVGADWPRGSFDLLSHCWVCGSQNHVNLTVAQLSFFTTQKTSAFLNSEYLKSRSVRRISCMCQPAFHMTKLDLKRILRGSLIRYLFAPLPPAVNVTPKVMPARPDCCSADFPHFNMDSVGAGADFRCIFGPFWPFLGPFLRQKLPIIGKELDLCGFQEGIEKSLVDTD